MVRWIIFILIYIAIDVYAFQALRTLSKNQWIQWLYVAVSAIILGLFIYQMSFWGPNRTMTTARMYTIGAFLVIFSTQAFCYCDHVWRRYSQAFYRAVFEADRK